MTFGEDSSACEALARLKQFVADAQIELCRQRREPTVAKVHARPRELRPRLVHD